jgi:hypothetical protein
MTVRSVGKSRGSRIASSDGGNVATVIASRSQNARRSGPGRASAAVGMCSDAPASNADNSSATNASKLGDANCKM